MNIKAGSASSPTSVVQVDSSKHEAVSDESYRGGSNSQRGSRNRQQQPHTSRPSHSASKSSVHKMPRQPRRAQGQGPSPMIDARSTLKIPPTLKDSRKLFVGGLPPDVTSEEFYNYFARFGVVLDSVVMFDKATKRSRGFGFITYDDPNVCQGLLQMGQQPPAENDTNLPSSGYLEMRGKIIELKRAEPKQSSPGGHVKRSRYTEAPAYSSRPSMPSSNSFQQHHDIPEHGPSSFDHHASTSRYPTYGYPPMTPMPYYAHHSGDQTHHVTPQAALDLAHHMLFYSQLLATPTLMAQHQLVSPMGSPAAMGFEPQSYSEYFQPYNDPNNKNKPAPRSPIPPARKKVTPGAAFQLGGGTFIPETDEPPPSLQIPQEELNEPEPTLKR